MAAFVLGMPEHKVRVIAPDVGGGFGSKIFLYNEEITVSWAVEADQAPGQVDGGAAASPSMTDAHGRDHITDAEMACRPGRQDPRPPGPHQREPRRLSLDVRAADPDLPLRARSSTASYKIGAIHCEVIGVFTNTTPVDAYRGAGRPEA